jgi:uncharacterized glyoxalase superfamily protein PhnB
MTSAGIHAHAVNPILNVSDFAASAAWFERLGWTEQWAWDTPPTFGGVRSGAVEIFMSQDGQGGRGEGSGVWLSIWVDDVDALHRLCLDQGIDVTMPPTDEPWGVREMHIRHPDGHIFRMSQRHHHDHPHDHDHEHPHDH